MAEHDVEGEEHRVRERERDPERLGLELDVREQVDAGDRQQQGGAVPQGPRPEGGERDHRQELDRRDRPERQPVDREVEAARSSQRAPRPRRAACGVRSRSSRAYARHGLRQSAKTAARCRDAEPRHAERVDAREQQDRERRPEVVEDRAADEVGVRRELDPMFTGV